MATQRKVCIDRYLPTHLMRPHRTMPAPGKGAASGTRSFAPTDGRIFRAIAPIGKTWMNGTRLRVRFLGGTAAQKAKAREQAGWWSAVANISFAFDDSPGAEIRINFDSSDGAWSYIGTDCTGIPANQPTMNLGFLDGGTAAHEFGHAIGLAHEHQNPAGGIRWNEAVVLREAARSPNFWDAATARHNIIDKYTADQIKGTDFDPDSIMLYFFPASWTLNGIGTKANDVLSSLDKAFIAGAQMYPRTAPTAADAKTLKVGAKTRTSASIGKAGEEDLYQFTAASSGHYIIDTQGPTDVVMKLFGPNNQTALIADDDDSGLDSNALIATDLTAGQYYVQVRHYSQASGTGKYSIKVRLA
jgi:hypothetical protein